MMADLVKVYLFEHDDGEPYFTRFPISTTGDFRRFSEERAHMVPAEMVARLEAAEEALGKVENELLDLCGWWKS
jgi:hypothetical protein